MSMQSARNRLLRVLSATVLATLFLCQVIGSFCPMVPPAVVAAATIHDVHAGHPMGEGRMCQESVPSSSKTFETPTLHPFPLITPFCPDITQTGLLLDTIAGAPPTESDPPLYTRLSTFRI